MVKGWARGFLVSGFFLAIFLLSFTPWEYDIWFHLKSGEIIAKQGIIHHDVFSYTAVGREWYPYEWLFQLGVYWLKEIFGLEAVRVFTAGVVTILIYIVYKLLRQIFSLPISLTVFISFAFYASVYDFVIARPHIVAYAFLWWEIYLILLYVSKDRNRLWATIPITLVWANFHGSVLLAIYLFLAYAGISFIYFRLSHEQGWLVKTQRLLRYSLFTFIATLLPPLGTLQYRLLWLFYQQRQLITRFVDEWLPLNTLQVDFMPFFIACLLVGGGVLVILFRRKSRKEAWFLLPIVPFIAAGFLAVRNLFLGYTVLTIWLAWAVSIMLNSSGRRTKRIVWSIVFILALVTAGILVDKRQPERVYLPEQTVKFLKTNRLQGNMYNGFGVGGYLLYYLYPDYKVFIDGRVDVYLCCEIRDMLNMLNQKNLPDPEYKAVITKFFDKYRISYAILTTKRNTVSRRIGQLLVNDPSWSLVFWTDDFQILVRRDGKNDVIIQTWGSKAATPLEQAPYRQGMEEPALKEYQQMLVFADSSRSRNAIAFILMQQGKFDQARTELLRAIQIEPLFDSPYMNLGELAVKDGNYPEAIRLYEKARRITPDRGFTYLRLGQLYLEGPGDRWQAKKVWETGLSQSVTAETRTKLQQMLENLSY